jgi:hypothetical protein
MLDCLLQSSGVRVWLKPDKVKRRALSGLVVMYCRLTVNTQFMSIEFPPPPPPTPNVIILPFAAYFKEMRQRLRTVAVAARAVCIFSRSYWYQDRQTDRQTDGHSLGEGARAADNKLLASLLVFTE